VRVDAVFEQSCGKARRVRSEGRCVGPASSCLSCGRHVKAEHDEHSVRPSSIECQCRQEYPSLNRLSYQDLYLSAILFVPMKTLYICPYRRNDNDNQNDSNLPYPVLNAVSNITKLKRIINRPESSASGCASSVSCVLESHDPLHLVRNSLHIFAQLPHLAILKVRHIV
jgi:hypothetical protein